MMRRKDLTTFLDKLDIGTVLLESLEWENDVTVTASFGVTNGRKYKNLADLIKNVDQRLYLTKNIRNTVI